MMDTRLKAVLAGVVFSAMAVLTAFAVRETTLRRIAATQDPQPIVQQPTQPEQLVASSTPDLTVPSSLCKKSTDGVMEACIRQAGLPTQDGVFVFDNPTFISGTTTAFENIANWKVVDEKGTVISQGFFTVSSPDIGMPGPFTAWLFYDAAPKSASGSLMVYEASAKDGEPIHVVTFPLKFLYGSWSMGGCDQVSGSSVDVYWSNGGKQKNPNDCTEVFPVKHAVCGDASANQLIAVHELLKGATPWEKSKGYATNLPDNLPTPEIRHGGQGKFLDFPYGFEGVAGSCRVGAIRAQIEKTVGEKLEIGVRGETATVLQP